VVAAAERQYSKFYRETVMADKPRLKVPKEAKKGEIIEIKTLMSHVMETGLRKDASGNIIPRKIINKFTCEFNGKPVFTADLEPAIAANPFLQFTARLEESGTFKFTWIDDDGTVTTAEEKITVT
jgi:sulfur-oxidizing protein SoxZ